MFDSNFKTIQWWSVLLMEQTGLHVPGENTQFCTVSILRPKTDLLGESGFGFHNPSKD